MYNVIAVLVSILLPTVILLKEIRKKEGIRKLNDFKNFLVKNKYYIAVYCILLIGVLVRTVDIVNYPAGLNQDEASAGYEAYSVLNYGVDRKEKSIPVHFISWGSGQNVLLSYLMMPFIALFGLNELTVRLPMVIIGCISLILVYKFFRNYNKKLAILGIFIFAICPWHIMKTRWALESNLFPDLILISIYIILRALEKKKISEFYIGIAILSLSVYSYGTSYMFLPIFVLLLFIYLIRKKEIKIKEAIIAGIIAFVITLPMILFVVINNLDFNEIKIGFITIPRLYENRYESVTTIFSGDLIKNIYYVYGYNK